MVSKVSRAVLYQRALLLSSFSFIPAGLSIGLNPTHPMLAFENWSWHEEEKKKILLLCAEKNTKRKNINKKIKLYFQFILKNFDQQKSLEDLLR